MTTRAKKSRPRAGRNSKAQAWTTSRQARCNPRGRCETATVQTSTVPVRSPTYSMARTTSNPFHHRIVASPEESTHRHLKRLTAVPNNKSYRHAIHHQEMNAEVSWTWGRQAARSKGGGKALWTPAWRVPPVTIRVPELTPPPVHAAPSVFR